MPLKDTLCPLPQGTGKNDCHCSMRCRRRKEASWCGHRISLFLEMRKQGPEKGSPPTPIPQWACACCPGQSLAFHSDTRRSPGNNQEDSSNPGNPRLFLLPCTMLIAYQVFVLGQSPFSLFPVSPLPWAPEGELVMDSYLKGPDSFLARFASLCVHVSRVKRVSFSWGSLPKPQPPTFSSAVAAAERKKRRMHLGVLTREAAARNIKN